MSAITRLIPESQFARAVIHQGVAYLAGQPADARIASVKAQTQDVTQKIDALLQRAGTDKSRLLSVMVYLSDMRLKPQMDEAWLTWADPHNLPSRACVEARLGTPGVLVMIMVTAAV